MGEFYNQEHVDYLKKIKFEKRLKKLEKKLKNKKIVLYGAGMFFQDLAQVYDLSGLNIIGISDRSFCGENGSKYAFGYPRYDIENVASLKPDYILVGTLNFVDIIEDLERKFAKQIKIRPLIKKPLKDLWKEIWK